MLVLAVVVFTVYRFCNVDDRLLEGSRVRIALNSLDGAVPGLFVCVGYLAMRPLASVVVDGPTSVSGRRFLVGLAVALLPIYYLATVTVWFTRQSQLPGDWVDLVEHLSFTQVFDPKRIFYTIGPAWAVSVAVLSSLLTIGLITGVDTLCRGRRSSRRTRIVAIGGVAVLVAATSVSWKAWSFGVSDRLPGASFTTWYGPVSNLDTFAVAMMLALFAVVRRHRPSVTPSTRIALRVAGVVVLGAAAVTREHSMWVTVYFATASAVGFGLLFAAEILGPRQGDGVSRMLRSQPLQRLATLSLGIYLWHEPLMLALRTSGLVRQSSDAFARDLLVVLLVSVAVSWATYIAVQVPALQLAALSTRVRRQTSPPPRDADALR